MISEELLLHRKGFQLKAVFNVRYEVIFISNVLLYYSRIGKVVTTDLNSRFSVPVLMVVYKSTLEKNRKLLTLERTHL